MSNNDYAISIIKSLTGHANLITIQREYVNYMGSLDGGLFLSQLIYWSDKGSKEWFYKTYDEWEREISLSKYQVSKQSRILKKRGFLKTKVKKANGAPTVHYLFLFDEFLKSFVHFLDNRKLISFTNDSEEASQTITELTTKLTTKIILCSTCRENAVTEYGEVCIQCQQNKEDRRARNAFATEVIEAWNLIFKDYPPVTHKEKGTMRIAKVIEIRKNGITDIEREVRAMLWEWYDDLGFRAHWHESLKIVANEPGVLVNNYFDFKFWLKKETSKDKTPVYIRCLNGKYTWLTEQNIVQNVPRFNQPITHVPGNPGF